MAKWDVSKLVSMSEEQLINVIRDNLIAWATEEAVANENSSFEDRYEEAKWSFIDALREEL